MDVGQFEDDDMKAEVKKMIALGLLDKDWTNGLNKQETKKEFTQRSSNNPSGPFEDDEMNEEVRNMIALGLLDKDWADGLNTHEAGYRFSQILSTGEEPSDNPTGPFQDNDMNEEVKNMIALGLLDKDWADGLNKQEAGYRLSHILSTGEAPEGAVGGISERMSNAAIYDNLPALRNVRKPQNLQENSTSSSKSKIFKLKPLSSEDPAFRQISADFENCRFKINIQSIQEVENEKQKKSFEDEKKFLKFQFGDDFALNVKDLYHGTKANNHLICSYGLDVRLSLQGMFGRGIYFSDNVKKCEKYLSETEGSSIYVCSVILGDMKEYPDKQSNIYLKIEPEKENGDRYHSVKGNMDGFNEYVIYENRRSLIKYRIVLEGAEEEDEDIVDEEVAKREKEENELEAWKRHVNYMVNSCEHDVKEDEETEQEIRNVEKVRLEVRWRREKNAGSPVTKLTYDLLKKERKIWKSRIESSTRTYSPPSPVSPELSASGGGLMFAAGNDSGEDNLDTDLQLIFDCNLSSFLNLTMCENTEFAKSLLMKHNGVLDNAIDEYYSMM